MNINKAGKKTPEYRLYDLQLALRKKEVFKGRLKNVVARTVLSSAGTRFQARETPTEVWSDIHEEFVVITEDAHLPADEKLNLRTEITSNSHHLSDHSNAMTASKS